MSSELLAKLFKWKKHIQYEDIDFYLRIVGDQTVEDTRQASLIESRKVRRAMRDPNSNEYLVHIDPMKDLDDDELKSAIIFQAARDVFRDYTATTPKRVIPPLKTNPTLEEQEQYQQALEDRDKDYIEEVQQHVEKWRQRFMEGLDKVPREVLERQYTKYKTDRISEEVFNRTFEDYIVASSIYKDPEYKQRAFTFEEFCSLPNDVKMVFKEAYGTIMLEPDELKKSQSPAASP